MGDPWVVLIAAVIVCPCATFLPRVPVLLLANFLESFGSVSLLGSVEKTMCSTAGLLAWEIPSMDIQVSKKENSGQPGQACTGQPFKHLSFQHSRHHYTGAQDDHLQGCYQR